MDVAVLAAMIAAGVSLVIAIGNWVFSWKRSRRNRRLLEKDVIGERRQRDVDRVLAYLEEYAVLAELYRSLARGEHKLVMDADGRPVLDEIGAFRMIDREVFPDEAIEDVRMEMEGKDIRGAIKLQAYRVSQSKGQLRDLLDDLDASAEAEKQLGLLYHFTVEGLRRTLENSDYWQLVEAVDDVDRRRAELRTLVRRMVNAPTDDSRGRGRR